MGNDRSFAIETKHNGRNVNVKMTSNRSMGRDIFYAQFLESFLPLLINYGWVTNILFRVF